jgi:hypothetical protein
MWFVSGIAMIYARDMPRLTAEERLRRLAPIDLARVRLTAHDAAVAAGLANYAGGATLITLLQRPAYRFQSGRVTVFADTGERFGGVDQASSLTIAAQFLDVSPSSAQYVRHVETVDQWTIAQRRQLPLHRVAVDNGDRTELYISERSGDVALLTTRGSRMLAWIAAIPHWLYFTPLRARDALWRQVILWTSGLGIISACAGVILAFTQFNIRYAGLFWWHYVTGAIVGVFALTWVFSGLLSMEPWSWASGDGAGDDVPAALAGGVVDLASFPSIDASTWQATAPREIKEIEFRRIQGDAYYIVRTSQRQPTIVSASTLIPREPFSIDSILQRIKQGEPDSQVIDSTLLADYDGYYYDRDRTAPLPVLRVKFDDANGTWMYIDPAASQVVSRFTRRERLQRWLYHGLHSLDFPFWYYRRPLWDAGVIALCSGGAVLSALGTVLGFRRLRRTIGRSLK